MVDRKEVIQKALDNLVQIAQTYDRVDAVDKIYDDLVMELQIKCDALKADMSQDNGYSRKLSELQHQLQNGDPTIQKKVWREIKNLEEEMLFEQPTPVNLDLTNIRREIFNLGSDTTSPQAPFSPPLNHIIRNEVPPQIPQPTYQRPPSQPSYEVPVQQPVHQPVQQPVHQPPASVTQPPVTQPPVTQQPPASQHPVSYPAVNQYPAAQPQVTQPSYSPNKREDRSRRASASSQLSNRQRRPQHSNSSQDIIITPRSDTQSLPPSNPQSRPPSASGVRQTAPSETQVLFSPDMFTTQTNIPVKNSAQNAVQNAAQNSAQNSAQSTVQNHAQSAAKNAVQDTMQYNHVPRSLLPHHLQPVEECSACPSPIIPQSPTPKNRSSTPATPSPPNHREMLLRQSFTIEPDNQEQVTNQYNANQVVQHNTDQNQQLVSMSSTDKYTDMCKNSTIKRFFTINTQYTNPHEWSKLEIAEFYNPHKFFVKAQGSSSGEDRAYDQISIKIMDHLDSALAEDGIRKSYPDGSLVLAKFRMDDQWYRGVITKQHLDHWYDVLFVDFGNSQNSFYHDIRPMPAILRHYPMMAQQCFLAEIDKPQLYKDSVQTNEGWLQDHINMIWELILNKKLEFRVLCEKKQVYGVVIMFEQEDGTKVNLNKKLIDMGLVVRDDSLYSRDAQESVLELCHSPTHFSPSTTFDDIPSTVSNIVEPTPFDSDPGPRGRGSINTFTETRRPGFMPSEKWKHDKFGDVSPPSQRHTSPPLSSPPSRGQQSPPSRRHRRDLSPKRRQNDQSAMKFGALNSEETINPPTFHVSYNELLNTQCEATQYEVTQNEAAQHEVAQNEAAQHETTQHETTQHETAQHQAAHLQEVSTQNLESLAMQVKPDTFGKTRVYAKAQTPSKNLLSTPPSIPDTDEEKSNSEIFILDQLDAEKSNSAKSNEASEKCSSPEDGDLDELESGEVMLSHHNGVDPSMKYNPALYDLGNMTKEHVLEMCLNTEPMTTLQIEPLQSHVMNAVHVTHVDSPDLFYGMLLNKRNVVALEAINRGLKELYDPSPISWKVGDTCSQKIQGVESTGEVTAINKNLVEVKWAENSVEWVDGTALSKGSLPSNIELKHMLSASSKPTSTKVQSTLEFDVGTYCAAEFGLKKQSGWHRALVLEVFRKKKDNKVYKYQVMFVDYGNVNLRELKDVRALPPKYLALPAQAIPCCVGEITPILSCESETESVDSDCEEALFRGSYPAKAAEAFENLIIDERVYLYPRGDNSTPLYYGLLERRDEEGAVTSIDFVNGKGQVSIFDSIADEFVDLIEEFIENGHAERSMKFSDTMTNYNPTAVDHMEQRMAKLAKEVESFAPDNELLTAQLDGEISSNYDTDSVTLSSFDPMTDDFSSESNLLDYNPDDISQAVYKEKLSKKRLCRFYSRGRKCFKGAECTFLHQRKTDFSSEQSNMTIVTEHKPPTPEEDMPIIVAVQSVVSAFHFWAQILPQDMNPAQISLGDFEIHDPLSQLTRQMTAHYQYRGYREKRLYPAIGEICAVRSRQANGNYRRSRITETDDVGERQCQVFHLDFGTFEIVPEDSLRVMEKQYILDLPFQAQEMFLADIKPNYPSTDEPLYIGGIIVDNSDAKDEAKAAKEFFKSKVINKWPVAKVIEKSPEGALLVHLWDCTGDRWCSINSELVQAGYAESLHPLPADLTTDNETTVANSTFDRSYMLDNSSSVVICSD